jgi:hypothetical protein
MKDNKHVQVIPSTVMTQVQARIDETAALLTPYVVALTPAERHELPKTGEKTIGFVEKAYDFAQQNPNLIPPYLDMAAPSVRILAMPTGFGPWSTASGSLKRTRGIQK